MLRHNNTVKRSQSFWKREGSHEYYPNHYFWLFKEPLTKDYHCQTYNVLLFINQQRYGISVKSLTLSEKLSNVGRTRKPQTEDPTTPQLGPIVSASNRVPQEPSVNFSRPQDDYLDDSSRSVAVLKYYANVLPETTVKTHSIRENLTQLFQSTNNGLNVPRQRTYRNGESKRWSLCEITRNNDEQHVTKTSTLCRFLQKKTIWWLLHLVSRREFISIFHTK